MTKKLNEDTEKVIEDAEEARDFSVSSDECIKLEGERSSLKKDDKTIKDDIDDYVFRSPRRKKKVRSKTDIDTVGLDNYPVVRSNRSSSNKKHKKHKRKKHRMKLWKKILIGFVSTILALVVLIIGTFAFLIYRGSQEMFEPNITITAPEGVQTQEQGEFIVYNGKTYQFNENITNILFMGIDKRNLDDSTITGSKGQADVIVLMAVDTKTGKTTMINISRDTMTDVTIYSANGGYVGSEVQQLCLSYAYGDGKETSCENTVNSVRKLFYNIPVKSYLSLDLDGISAVNDSIGGVDVVSPETIGDFVEGQSYHLEGNMAESFVRTRNYELAEANNLRMQRQQIYAEAFMQNIISATKQNIMVPVDLFNASSPYTCTNLNPSKICYLAETAVTGEGMSVEMMTVPGEVKMNGEYAEYYVDEDSFYELFLNVFYNEIQ